jgi:hypothetical protein
MSEEPSMRTRFEPLLQPARLLRSAAVRIAPAALALAVVVGIASGVRADEVEVPAWAPEPPPVAAGPPLPVAARFNPNDVAAPPAARGLLAPAPPAFDRFGCDTFSCGRGGLGVVESPTGPGDLPGDGGD